MINLAVGEDLLITLVKLIYDRMSNKFREIFDQLDWHFEAWGVSINDTQYKTYKISYRISNAIKNYNDCSEFYWQVRV